MPHAKRNATCPRVSAIGFFCQHFWLGISTPLAQVFAFAPQMFEPADFGRGLEFWTKTDAAVPAYLNYWFHCA